MKGLLEKEKLTEAGFMNICGLSGGGDSVYLLRKLCELVKDRGSILAVHINHCLRGEAADGDEEFCRELCEELSVPFISFREEVSRIAKEAGQTLEQAGRSVRYGHFYEEACRALKEKGFKGVNILLAHHKNDQEETVLMNFLRGSGPLGLSGMRSCALVTELNETGCVRLVRPLLSMTHEEITDELSAKGYSWREDATNKLQDYTRNKLRNGIIPALKEISPGFTDICCREAEVFYDVYDYMKECARREVELYAKDSAGAAAFPADRLLSLHRALRAQVVREMINKVWPLTDVGTVHVEQIVELAARESGKYVCLPNGIRVYKEFSMLTFGEYKSMDISRLTLKSKIYSAEQVDLEEISKKISRESYTKLFDYDTILRYCGYAEPVLRTPMDEDSLIINREGQRKRLAVYLKQEKIPARLRREIPVVAISNEILWVVSHRDSAGFFVTEDTKNILELSISITEGDCET